MINTITQLFIDFLVMLYEVTGSLGIAIILFTLILRFILLPLSANTIKASKKIRELQPELKKLKEKHKDKQALQLAQMELYKKYNVNPLAGCLPQLAQLLVLYLLYHALMTFLGQETVNGVPLNTSFLWLNLARPDHLFILPVLAGVTQFILSLMIAPGGEVRDIVPNKSKKKTVQKENEKEEDMAEMAATMQKQMIFILPFMTGIIALSFPSGLAVYWVVTTVFSIVQQYVISGWGGLADYSQRALAWAQSKTK